MKYRFKKLTILKLHENTINIKSGNSNMKSNIKQRKPIIKNYILIRRKTVKFPKYNRRVLKNQSFNKHFPDHRLRLKSVGI